MAAPAAGSAYRADTAVPRPQARIRRAYRRAPGVPRWRALRARHGVPALARTAARNAADDDALSEWTREAPGVSCEVPAGGEGASLVVSEVRLSQAVALARYAAGEAGSLVGERGRPRRRSCWRGAGPDPRCRAAGPRASVAGPLSSRRAPEPTAVGTRCLVLPPAHASCGSLSVEGRDCIAGACQASLGCSGGQA